MTIYNLKPGTRLLWDAPSPYEEGKRLIYPALVTHRHHTNQWVMVLTGHVSHWMGPQSEYLRWPTDAELQEYSWDSLERRANYY